MTGIAATNPPGHKANRVSKNVDAFTSVCLVSNMTVNRAAAAAKAASVGLAAPTTYNAPGSPTVVIAARRNDVAINDPDEEFDWFRCSVVFGGTSADQAISSVQAKLTAAGFRITSGFKREAVPADESWTIAPVRSNDGQAAIQYKGTVSRGGQTFVVLVAQSPAGPADYKGTRLEFSSITRLIFETR